MFIYFSLFAVLLFAQTGVTFYVDSSAKPTRQKGTAASPFTSLERAVIAAHARGNRKGNAKKEADGIPVTIVIRGDLYVEEAILLTVPVKIIGQGNPTITFGENAGFVVEQTTLELNNCSVKRSERFTEPRTVPILYGSCAAITLNGSAITAKEGGDVVILRESELSCTDAVFSSEQTAQAVLIRAEKSVVTVIRSAFSAKGLMALVFDFTETSGSLTQVSCTLLPRYTGRLAELAASDLKAQDLQCSYTSPLFETIDAALLADDASAVDLQEPLTLSGFLQSLIRKTNAE